jgi:putative ATPase
MASAQDSRSSASAFVSCPVCSKQVASALINDHLNSCLVASETDTTGSARAGGTGTSGHAQAAQATVANASLSGDKKRKAPQSHSSSSGHTAASVKVRRSSAPSAPLAERMRPRSLDEFIGQDDALATFAPLLSTEVSLPSLILWGPPGCGKTSFATVVEQHATSSVFKRLSAVACGVAEVRQCIETAAGAQRLTGRRTILFLDEIHRFNKAQQDAFLPHVEQGTVTLIGATTENPSFSLNSALLSRCRGTYHTITASSFVQLRAEVAVQRLGWCAEMDCMVFS